MPIQITKEDYEKKFGVKPLMIPTTSDIVDTKPAPIKITRAEWNSMQNQGVSLTSGQEIKKDFLDMGTGLNQAASRSGNGVLDTFKDPELSSFADKTTVAGGKVIRGISDFLSEAFIGLSKLALPKSVENRIKEKFTQEMQKIQEAEDTRTDFRNPEGGLLVSQGANQAISDALFGAKDYITERRAYDPRYKKLTDAAGNYAMGVADLFGAGKVDDVVEAGLKKGVDSLPDVSVFKNTVIDTLDKRLALKRQQDLYNIENSYNKLRKDMNKSSDANASSRTRIADANIWNNVVDTDGKMTTLGKGGAYEQYKRETIDGRETIVRDNLVREGATVNINELAQALKINVSNTGLEGAALKSAFKGIQRELDAFTKGLSKRTDEFGNIPLEKVQDFKTSTTKTIDYKKDNSPTISFKKAKARAYKEVIENKSKVEVVVDGKKYNVKGINAELAKYYKDLELISSLDGRRVKGGKLGKYFAQISGNIIGGAAGGAVGGSVGMAFGTVIGGEAGGFIKGRMMASSLGKGGKGIPVNPVLDAARKQAGLPSVKDLNTPDKTLGAPKGTPKTKEVIKVEGQIKKNVAQQKVAIKIGDFGLVAELKEVYAYLVIQLKSLLKSIKESAKNPTIGLSTKRVGIPEGTSYKDLVTMRDYTDMVYNKKTKLPEATAKAIANEMDSVARRLKLKNTFGGENALANEVNNILNDAQFDEVLQSKSVGSRNTQYSKINTKSKTDISKSNTQSQEKNGQYGENPNIKGTPDPLLKTKREVVMKDLVGNKFTVPVNTVIKPLIANGKTYIKVGSKQYAIPKNQYDNLKGQSTRAVASEFAPELMGTVETVRNDKSVAKESDIVWKDVTRPGEYKNLNGTLGNRKFTIQDEGDGFYVAELEGLLGKKVKNYSEAVEELNRYLKGATKTKYSAYTLDGGENYREILIQAPTKVDTDMSGEIVGFGKNPFKENLYQSSHWSEPNVISHIRMNERTVDGKKYAFMEELQSDWAREGRDKGFIKTNSGSEISELKAIIQKKIKGEKRTSTEISRATELTEKLKQEFPEWKNQYSSFGNYILNKEAIISGQIPNNPLLKDWQIPTTKRALIEAVDSGADRFAWINGEQTSARYNLATHVANVRWKKGEYDKGMNEIRITPVTGGDITLYTDNTGVVYKATQNSLEGKKLDEILGKGLADKIMEKETGTLSGEGLSFGGEWAKNLYDKQVRNIVKKLTGAEVKTVDMGLGNGFTKNFDLSAKTSSQTQQYIDLTPEVKARINSVAPSFKMKNPSAGESLPLIFLLLGGGAVATQG